MQLMNEMVDKKAIQSIKLYADKQGAIALAKDPEERKDSSILISSITLSNQEQKWEQYH